MYPCHHQKQVLPKDIMVMEKTKLISVNHIILKSPHLQVTWGEIVAAGMFTEKCIPKLKHGNCFGSTLTSGELQQ